MKRRPSSAAGKNQDSLSLEQMRNHPLRFVCSWRGRAPGYFPTHSHSVMELVHHVRGSGITTLQDGRRIPFATHGTVIYPAFTGHDQRMFTEGDDICVHVAASEQIGGLFSEAVYVPPAAKTGKSDRFVRTEFLHLAQLRAGGDRSTELDLRVTALVMRLLQLRHEVALEIPHSLTEGYVDQARHFIRENYSRITSMNEIARHVGVSEDYLRHLFQVHGGISLIRLLNQTRIERVKELLIHSRLPIKEIASQAGFKTERYLSTCFRKTAGMSPGSFRRNPPPVQFSRSA